MNAKLKIMSDGMDTIMELGGKTIGHGIYGVEFRHEGGCDAHLKLDINLKEFSYSTDGRFDEAAAAVKEEPPGNPERPE